MATRKEVEQRKGALLRDLRNGCQDGSLKPGALVPPVRELALRYQVSANVAHQAVQQLISENVIYTVAGVGTFVGRRQTEIGEFYLCTNSRRQQADNWVQSFSERMAQHGFAERIAQLGGASLTLTVDAAREAHERGELPSIAGIYGDLPASQYREIPHVAFFGHVEDVQRTDAVSYDDLDGGRQAAQHLVKLGHRKIAFLAAHNAVGSDLATDAYGWSVERETGWRETLDAAGILTPDLTFHPKETPDFSEESFRAAGRSMARALAARNDITAVVAANDYIAFGLFDGLEAMNTPSDWWPAAVGFDNLTSAHGQMMTSLHLPADELGRVAADLLWERRHGELTGPPVHRKVRMCLFPRLSSRTGWPGLMKFHSLAGVGVGK